MLAGLTPNIVQAFPFYKLCLDKQHQKQTEFRLNLSYTLIVLG